MGKKKTEKPAESWVPDLADVDLAVLGKLPDSALKDARKELEDKAKKSMFTPAGSEGS